MPDTGLFALYKLHLIDAALHEMREQANSLDAVREAAHAVKKLQAENAEVGGKAHAIGGELKDCELKLKTTEEKIKHFTSQLYGGSIVSPREVENIEKEIAQLKEQRAKADERILELWELEPPAREAAAAVAKKLAAAEKLLEERKQEAMKVRAQLEAAYKQKGAERPKAVAAVKPDLLDRYEKIRKFTGNVAITLVSDEDRCTNCGMTIPVKALDALSEDKVVACESCRRILFRLGPPK